MKMTIAGRFVLIVVALVGVQAKDFPRYLPTCHRDVPQEALNDCILKATDTAREFLRKGIPELGIPSIAPLTIPQIVLEQGTSSTNYKAFIKNITLWGLDGYQFTKTEFDTKRLFFHNAVKMPHLFMKGTYVIEGKFLNAPLQGQGLFFANITNSNGTCDVHSKIVTKKGVDYIIIDEMITKIDVGDVIDYGVDGLFADNEILARATKQALKDNLRLVVDEMKPAVEEVMTKLFRDVLFKAFFKIPYDTLYPISSG